MRFDRSTWGRSTLSDEELFVRCRDGDADAREEAVRRYLPLARRLAARYARGSDAMDDLCQVASVGLVKAIDRFDPARGAPFAAYARPTILGEVKRHFRDTRWAAHVPRDLQESYLRIESRVDRLTLELGHAPSTSDIADALSVDVEDVIEALAAGVGVEADSLDEPAGPGDGSPRLEQLGGDDPAYELVEDELTIAPAFRELPDRDRFVLRLRFHEGLTQREIGRHIGVSQMQVSRLLRRALDRLRDATLAGAVS